MFYRVALDEVSVAAVHSSPAVAKRQYAHFVRQTFNPVLRVGLSPGPCGALANTLVRLPTPFRPSVG